LTRNYGKSALDAYAQIIRAIPDLNNFSSSLESRSAPDKPRNSNFPAKATWQILKLFSYYSNFKILNYGLNNINRVSFLLQKWQLYYCRVWLVFKHSDFITSEYGRLISERDN